MGKIVTARCLRCGRQLTSEDSVNNAIGPICAQKMHPDCDFGCDERGNYYDLPFDTQRLNILVERRSSERHFNLPQCFSAFMGVPMDWRDGENFKGAKALAFEILALFTMQHDHIPLGKNDFILHTKLRHVNDHYEAFAREVILEVDPAGGTITGDRIIRWIRSHIEKYQEKVRETIDTPDEGKQLPLHDMEQVLSANEKWEAQLAEWREEAQRKAALLVKSPLLGV